MASEHVTCCKCGDGFKVVFSNVSRRDREWRVKNWDRVCPECWEKAKAEANAKAAEEAEKTGLPELVGTKAQVLWAETLRMNFVKDIGLIVKDGSFLLDISKRFGRDVDDVKFDKTVVCVTGQTSASYWIDNRHDPARCLVLRMLEKMKSPEEEVAESVKKDLEMAASAEATVRPTNPITETVAEISIVEKTVRVRFPEKREDFRQIVRFDLGFHWAEKQWERDCSCSATGGPENRAVEVGHVLLASGFCVRIFDETLRDRAVQGDFEAECKKWVLVCKGEGKYRGWFAIWWKQRDGDYYQAAKRLTRSVWDKPSVVVPPEFFGEVADFAEFHKFRISDDAANLIERARQARDSMSVVDVQYTGHEREKRFRPDVKPTVLEVPEIVSPDPELMDT